MKTPYQHSTGIAFPNWPCVAADGARWRRAYRRQNVAQRGRAARLIVLLLMGFLCVVSPWGTYLQFAYALNLAAISVFVALPVFGLQLAQASVVRGLCGFDLLLCAYFLVVLASLVWTESSIGWIYAVYWYAICFSTYVMVADLACEARSIRFLLLSSCLGVWIATYMIGPTMAMHGADPDREVIDGVNQNFTSYVLVGVIYLILYGNRIGILSRKVSLLAYLTALLAAFDVYRLGTRGAEISIVLMLVFHIFSSRNPRVLARPAMVASAVAAVGIATGLLQQLLTLVDAASVRSDGDLAGRLSTWIFARSTIVEHPWLGIGAGAFPYVNPAGIEPHNTVYSLMLDTGVVGTLCAVVWALQHFRQKRLDNAQGLGAYAMTLLLCYWVPIGLSGVWHLAPYSWIVLALAFAPLQKDWGSNAG